MSPHTTFEPVSKKCFILSLIALNLVFDNNNVKNSIDGFGNAPQPKFAYPRMRDSKSPSPSFSDDNTFLHNLILKVNQAKVLFFY